MAVPSVRFTNLTLLSPEGLQVRSGPVGPKLQSTLWSIPSADDAALRSQRP